MSNAPAARAKALIDRLREVREGDRLRREWHAPPDTDPTNGSPYPWQAEFCNAGARFRERGLLAANRIGKSMTGGAETACHLTGLYPPWWKGHRFVDRFGNPRPISAMAAGLTNEDVRAVQQQQLLGRVVDREPDGKGWVPRECIGQVDYRQCGVKNVVDTVAIKHVSGGWSWITFKSYEQGAAKFQGTAYDFVWMDEEPEHDRDIFNEVQLRLSTTKGLLIFTRTPKFGLTNIVQYFWEGPDGSSGSVRSEEWGEAADTGADGAGEAAGGAVTQDPRPYCMNKGWVDAPHFTPEMIEEEIRKTPIYLRDAVSKGIPALGTGAVWPIGNDDIAVDPFAIPPHYRRIAGCDFGIAHPAAGAWVAYDADADVVYVYDCYKQEGQAAPYHAHRFRMHGEWIPVSWPHDGENRDKGSGQGLADQYQEAGANMLAVSARERDDKGGGQPVEPIVAAMYDRMVTGRLKVFSNLSEWFREKDSYHRDDNGRIVAVKDDILKATMYAVMMLRYAVSEVESRASRPERAVHETDPLEGWL